MSEHLFVWPPALRALVLPRRGGVAATPPEPQPEPIASALARRNTRIRTVLGRPGHEPDVVEEGMRGAAVVTLSHRALASEAGQGQTPFGVAVALLASVAGAPWSDRNEFDGVADLLVERYGPVFAARTVAELGGLCVDRSVTPGPVVRRGTGADGRVAVPPPWDGFAGRVRRHLGPVPDDVHREVVAALAGYRDGVLLQRAAVSFLAPDQTGWVDVDVAALAGQPAGGEGWLLLYATHTAEQAAALAASMPSHTVIGRTDVVATLVDGVGPAIAPVLERWIDEVPDAGTVRSLLATMSVLPGDEAYAALLARSGDRRGREMLWDATRWFPERALRMLSGAGTGADGRLAALLRDTVLTHPEAVDRVLPTLPAPAADLIRGLRTGNAGNAGNARNAGASEAKPQELPPLLVSPPWTVTRRRPKPAVVSGLVAEPESALAWRPGEREEWLAHRNRLPRELHRDFSWADGVRLYRQRRLPRRQEAILVAWGPDEVVRPLMARWSTDLGEWLPVAVARFGLDVLPHVRGRAEESPGVEGRYLLPYATGDLAVLMAGWYARLRSGRAPAAQWLDRHAALAARTLVPPALGKAGAARREAEQTLRLLAARGHDGTVREAAAGYGPAAADGIAALLDTDPLDVLPAKVPALPGWLDVRVLPPVPLRDGGGVLPADAVRHLCTMLALSRPDAPYAGVETVRAACEPAALAGLGWALFERWVGAGSPSGDGWVLPALGLIGDDDTVRRLAPVIRAWPGEGGHARAVTGLDVLRAIGTDVALMHLYGISEKVRFKGLRDRATERIAEIATDLGLSPAELADRLVPDFGLDDDGGLTLDFGPRSFRVGFDERLAPYVLDGSGTRRAALPAPGANDDPSLAPAAVKRFAALRKDVRTAAEAQIRRLERAMVTGRRWSAGDFRTYLAGHPLLRHLARRLVWCTGSGESFRIAEDGTYADAGDDAWTLPGDATVRIAHPVHLGTAAKVWREVFADYEILQPFPQLGRETFALTEPERAATRLSRWKDRVVPTGRVLGLERNGWRRADPGDGGHQAWFERDLPGPDGHVLLVMIDPGFAVAVPTDVPEQRIDDVFIVRDHENPWLADDQPLLGTLDEVTASEVIRDLEEVCR